VFASLVLSMAAAAKKKKRKEEAYPWKAGSSSRHITNLKQSILESVISMVISNKNGAYNIFFLQNIFIS
jgi:hypothetical protein